MTDSYELNGNLLTGVYKLAIHMLAKTFEPLVELALSSARVYECELCALSYETGVGGFARGIWNLKGNDGKDWVTEASERRENIGAVSVFAITNLDGF